MRQAEFIVLLLLEDGERGVNGNAAIDCRAFGPFFSPEGAAVNSQRRQPLADAPGSEERPKSTGTLFHSSGFLQRGNAAIE
jgi:hypothetical protein